jgi:hypothetical protein
VKLGMDPTAPTLATRWCCASSNTFRISATSSFS